MLTRNEWTRLVEKFNKLLAYYRSENERLTEEVRVLTILNRATPGIRMIDSVGNVYGYDQSICSSTSKEI